MIPEEESELKVGDLLELEESVNNPVLVLGIHETSLRFFDRKVLLLFSNGDIRFYHSSKRNLESYRISS